MKKNLLFLSLLFVQLLSANESSEFSSKIKNISPSERKVICLEVMNKNEDSNPKLAYQAANCLIYNGNADLSIPLMTKYFWNGYNSRYLNNKLGHIWTQKNNPYNIDQKIFDKMTGNKSIFDYMIFKLKEESRLNYKKYGITLEDLMLKDYSSYVRSYPLTSRLKVIYESCPDLKINLNYLSCNYDKSNFFDCKISKIADFDMTCNK